jgi:hypothetical protein
MNNHLSQDQFERCVLETAGPSELEHIKECRECRMEVERFSKGLALFRTAIGDLAGGPVIMRSRVTGVPRWRWALVVAGLAAAVVLPFFVTPPQPVVKPPAEISPEAVMERLNRHLAGTVPEAMEPMLFLVSGEPPETERGEVR